MEISLEYLNKTSDYYDVKETIAKLLHSPEFSPPGKGRRLNFEVHLNLSEVSGLSNNGTGSLFVPNKQVGVKLLQKTKKKAVKVLPNHRRIVFTEAKLQPNRKSIIDEIRKVPYQDPSIDKFREETVQELKRELRLDKVQFGYWLRRPLEQNRGIFAVEWPREGSKQNFYASLRFDYFHKAVRVQLGDPLFDHVKHHIVLKISNIRELWIGWDFGKACMYHLLPLREMFPQCFSVVCFDLTTPSILEREWLNRGQTGNAYRDQSKFRQRTGAVLGDHGDHPLIADYAQNVAQYAHHCRITFFEESDLQEFIRLCGIAGLRNPRQVQIDEESHGFFSPKRLDRIQRLTVNLPWPIAFQVEALLLNGMTDTETLSKELYGPIIKFAEERPEIAGGLLTRFVRSLSYGQPVSRSILEHFRQYVRDRIATFDVVNKTSSDAYMLCHHVTITPTRMKLEGPYPIQSNRVLRQYRNYHDNFLRVSFRDEDCLQYKWDREVDGSKFLQDRVGGTLKTGIILAGRHFEFLAYSSSALREHSVWFMSPFEHPSEGFVTAAKVRKSLGDFSQVLNCPAKFAARLSQAFTATVPSVKITRDQWSIIPDLGEEPYLFTDGQCNILHPQKLRGA